MENPIVKAIITLPITRLLRYSIWQMQRPSSWTFQAIRPENTLSDSVSIWIWYRFVAGGIIIKMEFPQTVCVCGDSLTYFKCSQNVTEKKE